MKTLGLLLSAAFLATVLLVTSLPAQRYQPRDHHVFHPPVQTKHQPNPTAASPKGHAAPTSTAAMHNRDVNFNGEAGTTMRTPKVPGGDYNQPH